MNIEKLIGEQNYRSFLDSRFHGNDILRMSVIPAQAGIHS